MAYDKTCPICGYPTNENRCPSCGASTDRSKPEPTVQASLKTFSSTEPDPAYKFTVLQWKGIKEQVIENQKKINVFQAELDKLKHQNDELPILKDIESAIEYYEELSHGCKKCGKFLGGSITWPKRGGGPLCGECSKKV